MARVPGPACSLCLCLCLHPDHRRGSRPATGWKQRLLETEAVLPALCSDPSLTQQLSTCANTPACHRTTQTTIGQFSGNMLNAPPIILRPKVRAGQWFPPLPCEQYRLQGQRKYKVSQVVSGHSGVTLITSRVLPAAPDLV